MRKFTLKKKVIVVLLTGSVFFNIFSQDKNELEERRKTFLKKIEYTNKLLVRNKNKIGNTSANLKLIINQIDNRKNLVSNIESEIEGLDVQISNNEQNITLMENDLNLLRNEYAKIIYSAYKTKRSSNTWLYILSSESLNQAYRRYKYVMDYSEFRRKQKNEIVSKQNVIREGNEVLIAQREEKKNLLFAYSEEANNLRLEIKRKEELIVTLRANERKLKNEIEENKKQERKIANEIAKLIREERNKSYSDSKRDQIISNQFLKNEGTLLWPVDNGVVISRYGKHFHPVLRNVELDNPGIDISTNENANVHVVYDGEISGIYGILGANNTVIVKHGTFYTVYQNVIDLEIKKGTKVKKGDIIGKVYTDVNTDQSMLHFQIWNGNKTVDPMRWITKNY